MERMDERFLERVQRHPSLKKRFESILGIAENSHGEYVRADDAEEPVIEEVDKLGQETPQEWANGQNVQQIQKILEETGSGRPYKKTLLANNLWQDRNSRGDH